MIPATKNRFTALPTASVARRKVAGYARVSTDSEEQQTSYEAQVDYYTHYIQSREDWEFVGVYTDEGISATNTKHRDGFKQMVKDALAGKIDLIVTKSVSRFARNTVDSLTTVRKLKEHGTEIYFEKENIFTFDSKGELLITIMSSLAQEESRSISENVTWGQRKRFADGKVSMPYKQFLGYEKGEDGTPVINEEEAAIVRLIYKLFLEGKTPAGICRYLEQQSILTPSGKQKWSQTTVDSILSNEKYKGDALLQKKFTTDFLTKKMKVNEGEVPQYYVEKSHAAIVEPLEWDMVQTEIARRRSLGRAYSGNSVFSSKLVCGDCGGFFGQKVWHSNDPYRKLIWRCNSKFKGEAKCATPHLDTETIQQKFLTQSSTT
jgi:DNA invertase Pin-like site-specific DNA recombinase